jgi:hypothetical protein
VSFHRAVHRMTVTKAKRPDGVITECSNAVAFCRVPIG